VYNKVAAPPGRAREFNREDMELMGTMAALIAASLENALTFQTATLLAEHNELLVHSLTSLYEISSALMTTVRMDELLAIITRALTYERGFGFDRAMILAMNEDEDTLEGAVYREVIPEDRLENGPSLSEALREAGEISPFVRDSSLFSSYRLPVTLTDHVLVRTALEKRSFTVLPGDPEHSFDPPSPVPFGAHEFATLPLLAKGKVVGVLAVDRDHRRLALDPADHQNLSMLANQAGLAIENSRLYEYIEKAKEQLSVARGRLIEAEKLAALGELAAGMAHEIRNPLVTIGGFTRRMLKGLPEDAPQRAYVEVVITQVNRLEKILGEVLDFSGSQVSHLAEHNLNDLVADALYIFRREMDQGAIEICREFGPTPTVHVDDGQIKQVFFNLFYNAIQAMTRGGGLRVRTFATRIGDREFAACEVSDTGPGIPNDILPQIFNPFFTTKDDGTGLGLSIVHKIVTRHHGEIDVVNLEGQGASFTIKLPAAAQAGLYLK
jgi:signal transduction histidine kinase